eukprot:TRINITY_DN8850_c0_g1_i1.p1 TRINITY_DN8850_c0_g1~~TRINITY_DN8850_c0_g1_i1.p1  ORF type:complete len:280 (+),score=18.92 TRINITY_DN8850_c0_g1_i1:34-840(+)
MDLCDLNCDSILYIAKFLDLKDLCQFCSASKLLNNLFEPIWEKLVIKEYGSHYPHGTDIFQSLCQDHLPYFDSSGKIAPSNPFITTWLKLYRVLSLLLQSLNQRICAKAEITSLVLRKSEHVLNVESPSVHDREFRVKSVQNGWHPAAIKSGDFSVDFFAKMLFKGHGSHKTFPTGRTFRIGDVINVRIEGFQRSVKVEKISMSINRKEAWRMKNIDVSTMRGVRRMSCGVTVNRGYELVFCKSFAEQGEIFPTEPVEENRLPGSFGS